MNRKILYLALVAAVAGCSKTAAKPLTIQTAAVTRRDISVVATATGVIEPINVIEVKSKTASGQVMRMPIEIGTHVRPGDLILQIDTTTDLHTNYMQTVSDLAAAQSNFDVAKAALDRQTKLFNGRIITQPELESAQTAFATAQATLLRNKANVELAGQKLKDATVLATVEGTIITKPVSNGQVIQAGGTSVSGGTVIATMADLSKVRARALVNETDIGQVKPGQPVNVTVDAFPDQTFSGTVEKIEPSATVQQNVTMFPVLVSLSNEEGLLRPGMNGEVNVLTDERVDVLAVPNDAIRSTREATQAAALLGLNPDSVNAQINAGRGGGMGGNRGGANGGGGGRGPGNQVQTNRGELVLPLVQGDPTGGQNGGRRGGGGGGFGQRGGGFQVQVTDAECKAIDAAMKKKPAAAKKLDDLRTKMRDPGADRQAMQGSMKALYEELGIDGRKSGACQRRAGGGQSGGGGAMGGGAQGRSGTQGRGGAGAPGAAVAGAPGGAGGGRVRSRSGLVFVQSGTTWIAKNVRLGVANYDYTEVLDGLKEGDKVALLSVAALQAKRQEQNDRMKAGMGGSPLGGGGSPPRGGGPGRGGP